MANRKVAVLQSNYIPWKGYFDIIRSAEEFVFYDDVQFTKNDWRNRNKIKTPQGVQWITVPVRQLSLDQKILETKIATKSWGKKHWNTLKTNYARAEYFKLYAPLFEQFYLTNTHERLSDINHELISMVSRLLGIETRISHSRNFELEGDRNTRLVNLVKKLNGNVYLSGPSAKAYLDENLFNNEGIVVEWMDYSGYTEYRQLYPPFEHGVSILDLIFSEGPNAVNFMKRLSQ